MSLKIVILVLWLVDFNFIGIYVLGLFFVGESVLFGIGIFYWILG